MVHSNMLMHFSGHLTDCFDREFRCMYADSQIIDRFYNPDEEGLPGYSYHMPVPNLGLDFLADYGSKERVYSEHSSSQSSGSVSSIKAAPPGMKSSKVTPDKKNTENSQKPPDRKAVMSPVLQKPSGPHIVRGSPNGTHQSQAVERTSFGQTAGVEWSKSGTSDYLHSNIPGQTSKIQGLGIYSPSPTQQSPTDNKVNSKYPLPAPFISKFTDLFSSKEKDFHFFQKVPTHSSSFGGPDLSQNEPERKQGPPPAGPMLSDRMGPEKGIHRRDEKRMTLGHSKLDLVTKYNKLNQSKQVYSRFELKNNIPQ